MAIPDFQSMMLPLLRISADGIVRSNREIYDMLAETMNVTEEQKAETLPSGLASAFENRAGWSLVYLTKAGLLERRGRGQYSITQIGLDTLKKSPDRIDMRYLKQYEGYQKWRSEFASDDASTADEAIEIVSTGTPQERIDHGYTQFRAALADEVLSKVKSCSPRFFERLVVELLVKMGYGGSVEEAARIVGKSGDGGIDGIINEDKLGLDVVYVQAKRWEANVGRPVVQAFAGSLEGVRARKGVLITTSAFTQDAEDYIQRIEKRIILINGSRLAQLMIDHDIGVSTVTTYSIKRIDSDYFEE